MPVKMPRSKSLSHSLKEASKKQEPREPVWKGPGDTGPQGGITQSMLSMFIVCRERFRLRVIEGLGVAPSFNHRIEYGSMWHVCEEYHAETNPRETAHDWESPLREYAEELCQKYRTQQEQVQHWYNVCKVQFPIYIKYWAKHPDVKNRTPLLQEQTFQMPYTLPSGRVVYLRGKWDSVDLIGKGKSAGVYLQENKTKGDIKEEQLKRQLASGFDLQTMLYLVALEIYRESEYGPMNCQITPIRGVRYNVVRRPLSGGRGSISQHKPNKSNPAGESSDEFYARLRGIIEAEPEYFFMRWKVEVSPADIKRFKHQCLDPLLEQLCDWWNEVSALYLAGDNPFADTDHYVHWRTPYGIWNVLAEGGSTEVDEYLNTGSIIGLIREQPLFQELD